METPHLGNIAFWASDFTAMREFYSEVIGLAEIAVGGEVGNRYVFYMYGSFSFSFNEAAFTPPRSGWSKVPMPTATGDHWGPYVTLYVPALTEVIERAKAKGITLRTDAPFSLGEGFGFSMEMLDPDGNAVAVTERPEPVSNDE